MIYFTDGILIPGDKGTTDQARDLSQALNGSGMIKCAQVSNEPDLVVDYTKSAEDESYTSEVDGKIKSLMDERLDVDYDTGGAWGGPGGSSEYWGAVAHEPEVTVRIPDGEVIIKVVNVDDFYRNQMNDLHNGDENALLYEMHDWLAGNVGPRSSENDGLIWDVERVGGQDDLFRVFWTEDENWKPEPPEPDLDY